MPRYKLTIEYDGTTIKGWQRQDDVETGQGFLEAAIAQFSGERLTVHCAGRTDAGVHATGQVAHVDLQREWDPFRVREALNAYLRDKPLSILEAERVGEDFHARFSAKGRRYLYRIANRRPPPALDKFRVWHVAVPLDAGAMHEAAQSLVGTYDFTSFRASECQGKSPVKTLELLDVVRVGDEEIHIHAQSRSFLHHQVRNMVGSLSLVGQGKWSVRDLEKARDARDRRAGGPTAPAEGLYFTEVYY